MYSVVNDALNQVFLGGRFESRPLYLVLDDRARDQLAELLETDPGEVEAHCCAEVGQSLARAGDPYKEHELKLWTWTLQGSRGLPPFTALLFALSHAAELMVGDNQFNAANYYQRLSAITGVPAGRLSQHGRSTEQFWRALNGWLAQRDFRFGRPTARAVNTNKYVGIAMSQAIVREEDRLRFHGMFEKYGFTGTDVITEEEITQYIGAWITTSRPTRQLKAAWAKAELRPRIAEIAVAELEDWTAEIIAADGSGKTQGKRLSLALSYRHDLFARAAAVWLGREDTVDDVDLERLDEGSGAFTLGNSTFGSFATLEPRERLDLPAILSRGVGLTSASGEAFQWAARAVIPLSQSERGAYWTEVNRVTLGVEHVVLVRGDARVKAGVEAALEEIAAPGYTLATPAILKGLPEGWLLYEKVVVLRQLPGPITGFEGALSPVGQTSGLQFVGGLRMGRGIYHEWAPPTAVLETQEPGTTICAWDGLAPEGDPLAGASCDIGQASLQLGEPPASSGNLYVEGRRGNEVIGSSTLLLRSAIKARPLDRQGRGELGYVGNVSASPLVPGGGPVVRGMDAPAVPVVPLTIALDEFGSLAARDAAPESMRELQVPTVPARPAISISDLPLQEQLTLPCAARGFHYFRIDTVPPGYPRHAPVNMECKQCRMAMLHKRQQATTTVKEREKAKREVPPSDSRPAVPARDLPVDLWLDAACFLGNGSTATFEALLSSSDLDPWQVGTILRDLAWLGHLDLCLGEQHRVKAWSAAPPSLSFTSERTAVLCGFRSSSLLDDIEEMATSAGGRLVRERISGQPQLVRVEGLTVGEAMAALDVVSDAHGRTIGCVADAPATVAKFALRSGSIFSTFRRISADGGPSMQRFDPESAKWLSVETMREPGAYRLAYAGTTYAYRGRTGQAYAGPHELVKLAAARSIGVHLHAYDASNSLFRSRLGCEPPGLLGRALVACSGRLPETRDGESHFNSVPPDVARAVLACLYTGDLPS